MAISKMKLINIVGPSDDFEDFCADYLMDCDMHLENVAGALESVSQLGAYSDENPYADILAKIKGIYQRAGISVPAGNYVPKQQLSREELEEKLSDISVQLVQNEHELSAAQTAIAENEQIIAQLKPLLGVEDVAVDNFFHFDFVMFRFGRMPVRSLKTLEDYLGNIDAFFIPTSTDGEYVWGMYFMPNILKKKIDAIFASLYFERTRISDKAHGTPKQATVALSQENSRLRDYVRTLNEEIKAVVEKNSDLLHLMYLQTQLQSKIAYIRRFSAHTRESFCITGWMTDQDVSKLEHALLNESQIVVQVEEPQVVGPAERLEPPTRLRNFPLVRPFELFVHMYGRPGYYEIDPTPLVAVTYMLMFGIMFGDVGQGAILCLGGFLFAWLKKSKLGGIVGLVGISSIIFGILFGSVFGHEDILTWRLINPMESMDFVLLGAVALGMILIGVSMVFNIINGVLAKSPGKIWFSQNGVAGLLFYWSAVLYAVHVFMNMGPEAAPWLIGLCIAAPLIVIFLQQPLSMLAEKRKDWIPKEKGMFFLENFFEFFEIMLSYVTNTMSFIRVGAFALNHVGMMSVVFLLSKMAGDGAGNIVVQIFGNILVIGLEGLIVGIQVLRLEYYEMFSRFFVGDGKEFKSIRGAGMD